MNKAVQELWDQGLTSGEIRKKLGLRANAVASILRQLGITKEAVQQRGIERVYPPNPERDEAIYQGWLQGKTYAELSVEYHVSDHIILKVMAAKKVSSEERNSRRGGKKRKPRKAKCCACGILIEYCEKVDTIHCEDCSYLECDKRPRFKEDGTVYHDSSRRHKVTGEMCSDCQEFLNVEPRCAGNIAALGEGGNHDPTLF